MLTFFHRLIILLLLVENKLNELMGREDIAVNCLSLNVSLPLVDLLPVIGVFLVRLILESIVASSPSPSLSTLTF